MANNNYLNKIRIGSEDVDIHDIRNLAASGTDGGAALKTGAIPFGIVDSTSTATAFTATVDGITELTDGTCVLLKNGVVTSAAGFTIDINNLGAHHVFNNLSAATAETTIFNINYTMLFVYDSTRVVSESTGAWCCYRGYDSNTNTIGYQLRSNSYTKDMADRTYRYRILFSSADNSKWVPANTSTSTSATTSKTVCQTPINPFGEIVYYGTTASVAAGSRPAAANLWQQYTLALGYSFNKTGAALTLTSWEPVYVKCAPQANGSAIIDSTTPYVQSLPSTDDGKIYIFLGVAYSATNIELLMNHPVFYYKDGAIRSWANTADTTLGTLNTNNTTALTASSSESFGSTINLHKVSKTGSYSDLLNKPTIPDDSNLVHKTGNETISGTKTFGGENADLGLNIGGASANIVLTVGGPVNTLSNGEFGWISVAGKGNSGETLQQALDKRNNVQSDWNQTTTTAADYIKNKPTIPTAQIQADWNLTTTTSLDYIKNKPNLTNNNGSLNIKPYDWYGGDINIETGFDGGNITIFGGDALYLKSGDDDIYIGGSEYTSIKLLSNTYYKNKEIAVKDDIKVTSVNGMTGAVNLSIPDDSNLVHKTGNETISGNKRFNDNIYFHGEATGEIYFNDELHESQIRLKDDGGKGWVQIVKGNGTNAITLQAALDERNNVLADWSVSDTTSNAYILNKPSIPNDSNLVHKTGNETIAGDKTFNGDIIIDNTNSYDIIGKFIAGPDFSWIKSQYGKFLDTTYTLQQALDERNNVQADWNLTTTTADDYIKNKPINVSSFNNDAGYLTEHQDISGKLDVITDLDTIRAEAALGSTAYQKPSTGIPKSDLAQSVQTSLGKADTALQQHQDLSSYADGAEYDSTNHFIYLKHGNTRLANPINANDFIKDGMVDTVAVTGGNLVITFNTDSGKLPITIPISDIFDANNYYTKTEIDNAGYITEHQSLNNYYTKSEVDTKTAKTTARSDSKLLYNGQSVEAVISNTGFSNTNNLLNNGFNMAIRSNSTNPFIGLKEGNNLWYAQAASNYFYFGPTSTKALRLDLAGNGVFQTGSVTATKIIKSGGTSSLFLKADGSVDNNTYLTSFTETDPTVPAWAKASTKPTYTAQEVGALPNTYTPPVTSVNGMTGAVTISHPVTSTKQSKINYITGSPSPNGIAFGASTSQYIHFDTGDFNVRINSSSSDGQLNGQLYFNNNEVAFKNDIKVSSVNGMTGAVTLSIPDDSNLVHKTGNETISGVKTFGEIRYGHNVDMLNAAWDWIKYVDMEGIWHTLQQDLDARNNVQADWNQTVATAADYIKNKPNLTNNNGNLDIKPYNWYTGDINIETGFDGGNININSGNHLNLYADDGNIYLESYTVYNNKEIAVKDDIPTNVSAFTNDAGYLTSYTETDPTVPAWAKASTKPTYTAAEVGALPDTTVIPDAPGTLNTNNSTAQTVSSSESLSGTIKLHKISKTGSYNDLLNKPTIPDDSNLVHKTGNETIFQTKTFADNGKIHLASGWHQIYDDDEEESLQEALDARNNVQSDWNVSDSTSSAYIKNKPSIPNDSNLVHKTGNETINGIKTFGGSSNIKLSSTIERHVPELITGNTLKFDWIKIHADLTEDDLTLQQALDERNNVQSDWNVTNTSSDAYILNKPDLSIYAKSSNLATVATSGSYNDLSDKPTIPTVNNGTLSISGPSGSSTVTTDVFHANLSGDSLIAFSPGTNTTINVNSSTRTITIGTTAEPNVQSNWNETDTSSDAYILNKPTIPDITGKADKVTGAVNGNFAALDSNGNLVDSGYSYTDLNELSDLYTPATESSELEPGDTYEEAFGKLEKTITDNEYVTALALNDLNTNKQDTLESGINIKTINGESILGDGNFNVTGDCIAYPTFSIDNNGHLIMRGGDPRLFEIVNGHLIYTYQ